MAHSRERPPRPAHLQAPRPNACPYRLTSPSDADLSDAPNLPPTTLGVRFRRAEQLTQIDVISHTSHVRALTYSYKIHSILSIRYSSGTATRRRRRRQQRRAHWESGSKEAVKHWAPAILVGVASTSASHITCGRDNNSNSDDDGDIDVASAARSGTETVEGTAGALEGVRDVETTFDPSPLIYPLQLRS